ncbi:hypothetical protein K432DRAFT_397588 [Lepidopterella palustris CBS 459.81]|uniref:WW domain-containing protein n=1 Tax=Lepidopterella palustris CBS 459.81 TaxID=1314670 RepID=A0A8E2E0Q4_9PEZI|nr:hypothetical protein K432DRAFT_397588 [Lepidopterella palustris CBS 459.81]
MSAPIPGPPPPGQAAPVPEGWVNSWSPQFNTWFYYHPATNTSQWHYPAPPPPGHPPTAGEPSPYLRPAQSQQAPACSPHIQDHQYIAQPAYGHVTSAPSPQPQTAYPVQQAGYPGALAAATPPPPGSTLSPYPQQMAFGTQPSYPGVSGGVPSPAPSYQQAYQQAPPAPLSAAPQAAPPAQRSPNKLYILAAAYGVKDVTKQLQDMAQKSNELVLSSHQFDNLFGQEFVALNFTPLVVMYQYGDRPIEVATMPSFSRDFEIKRVSLSRERMAYVNSNTQSRILVLTSQTDNKIHDENIVSALETEGEIGAASADLMGCPKYMVCFYRANDGSIKTAGAKSGDTLRMPWNPLAAWG